MSDLIDDTIAQSDFDVIATINARLEEDEGTRHNEVVAKVDVHKQGGLIVAHQESKLRFLVGDGGKQITITPETGLTAKEIGEWFIKQHENQRAWQRLCAEFEREHDEKVESGELAFEEYAEAYPDPSEVWGET